MTAMNRMAFNMKSGSIDKRGAMRNTIPKEITVDRPSAHWDLAFAFSADRLNPAATRTLPNMDPSIFDSPRAIRSPDVEIW
mmetsp:Transcript_53758/g.85556  ORF Transcript_53758/g.85556 Transcript_53758/m.85556 type:complete len:81 (-) Transcript_53758:972-1214(-)